MQESALKPGTRVFVGHRSELPDGTQRIVSVPGGEIGVIAHGGHLYAYRNRCAHQGGPVCEGMVIGRVMAAMTEDKKMLGEYFSESEPHLVCPWHGMEFLLESGESAVDPRFRLHRHEVVEDPDGTVHVVI